MYRLPQAPSPLYLFSNDPFDDEYNREDNGGITLCPDRRADPKSSPWTYEQRESSHEWYASLASY